MNTVIAFIIIFGALVFFHELGHLVMAKRAGILCREFAIGFGPKILSFKWKETVYTIRLLPIGGFVRMAGEDPEMIDVKPGYHVGLLFNPKGEVEKIILNKKDKYPNAKLIEVEEADLEHGMYISGYEDGERESIKRFQVSDTSYYVVDGEEIQIAPYNRQFAAKTLGQRTLAIIAGPFMNFLLAFVVLFLLGLIQGVPANDPVFGEIVPNSPAEQAGFKEGDVIKEIEGTPMKSWSDVVGTIRANPEKELEFTIERAGKKLELTVTPDQVKTENQTIGQIGVYSPVEKSFLGSLKYGLVGTYTWTKEILTALGKLVTGQFSINMLSGPVGIYDMTGKVVETGFTNLLSWTALLSINLGIMNLLPIPALDGGRLLFFAIEAVRGKPVDRQKEGIVHFIGFALLMLLMLVVTWNDIQRFLFQN